jgi:hypothetical protein
MKRRKFIALFGIAGRGRLRRARNSHDRRNCSNAAANFSAISRVLPISQVAKERHERAERHSRFEESVQIRRD